VLWPIVFRGECISVNSVKCFVYDWYATFQYKGDTFHSQQTLSKIQELQNVIIAVISQGGPLLGVVMVNTYHQQRIYAQQFWGGWLEGTLPRWSTAGLHKEYGHMSPTGPWTEDELAGEFQQKFTWRNLQQWGTQEPRWRSQVANGKRLWVPANSYK
jgi:hypothetical protein